MSESTISTRRKDNELIRGGENHKTFLFVSRHITNKAYRSTLIRCRATKSLRWSNKTSMTFLNRTHRYEYYMCVCFYMFLDIYIYIFVIYFLWVMWWWTSTSFLLRSIFGCSLRKEKKNGRKKRKTINSVLVVN